MTDSTAWVLARIIISNLWCFPAIYVENLAVSVFFNLYFDAVMFDKGS